MPDPSVAETTIGPYVVERELGRGAFGVVYRAFHEDDPNTPVALKVVESRGDLEKLRAEPAMLAKLDHPCVVRVLDHFVHDGNKLAIALEFIPGQDLKATIDGAETFPEEVVRDILLQIGGALAEAHAKGVVHRDLKPANVLVDRTGRRPRYVLTDFGVGAEHKGIRSEKRVAGTYLFMAPEQLRGRPGPQSDLWALGVTAYRMLSGVYPFPGPNLDELTKQIALTSPRPPSAVTGRPIDPRLERAVMRLLDRSETERISSAKELLRELGYAGDSKNVLAGSQAKRPASRAGARPQSLEESLRQAVRTNYALLAVWVVLYLLCAFSPLGLVTIGGLFLFFRAHTRLTGGRKAGLIAAALVIILVSSAAGVYLSAGSRAAVQQWLVLQLIALLPREAYLLLSVIPFVFMILAIVLPVLACNSFAKAQRLRREQVLLRAKALGQSPDEFLALLRRELEYRYEDVGFHERYAEGLAAVGDDRAAAVEARLLLVQDPYHFTGNLLLAQCYYRLGLLDDAAAVCDAYLRVAGYCFEFAELRDLCRPPAGGTV